MAAPITSPARLVSDRPTMSAEAFDAWAENQPGDGIYELIAGEIVEMPSNAYVSLLAGYILYLMSSFVIPRRLGWLTGEAGGFRVNGQRYAPDVAFMRYERQHRPDRTGYNQIPPDIAIEILSSDSIQEQQTLRIKLANYLLAGTTVLVVNSVSEQVELHVSGQAPVIGDRTSRVRFDTLLPGFVLDMQAVFDYASDAAATDQPAE